MPSDSVPLKPKLLAELKSNNYLLNALTMMEAKHRGGTFGVLASPDGNLFESCVLNIVAISSDRILRTPPFDNALAGTTVRRIMELARTSLCGAAGGGGATLHGVRQEALSVADARASQELFLCAGDTHLYPITRFEGCPVGNGCVGPVTKALQALLTYDAAEGDGNHESIDQIIQQYQ